MVVLRCRKSRWHGTGIGRRLWVFDMVERRIRLPRTDGSIRKSMRRRRLDLVSLKRELVTDIMHFGGEYHLETISEVYGSWGQDTNEVLNEMSLSELMKVHRWLGLSPPRPRESPVIVNPAPQGKV
jgi:hypothetical protein